MKINEVIVEDQINENPLDFAKKVGAGLSGLKKGGIAGARAGYSAQGDEQTQVGVNKQLLASALDRYNKFAAPFAAAGQQVSKQQAQAWFNKFSGASSATAPISTDPIGIQQWLAKEIPAYMAAKSNITGTGISAGQVVEKDGQQYKWDGSGWRNARGQYPSRAVSQELTQLAGSGQGTPKQQSQTPAQVPQGEAKSPTDVVNRLMKLHPDWVPEITKQLLNKQTVTAR